MRLRLGLPAILVLATLAVPGYEAIGQDDDRWRMTLTPYLWLVGMTGTAGFAGGVADVDLSPSDVLGKSDITVTALFEARRRRWVVRFDGTYFATSDQGSVANGGNEAVVFESEQGIVQGELGYAVVDGEWGGIDLLGGARYWHPIVNVTAAGGVNGSIDVGSGSVSWIDGTAGVRVRGEPAPRWHLSTKGDIGAGGSKLSWQAVGAVGFDVAHCCALAASYRHLDVNYDRDGFVHDSYLSGFALGLMLRFGGSG